jgi:hygromycin-B 7''-O-kinase
VDDLLAEMAARYGEVRPLPTGVANHVYLLGDDRVLRVPRSAEFLADLRKEAAVIPIARAAGVRTPELVSFSGRAMVLARLPGTDLAGRERPPAVLRELGREMALLHRGAARPPEVPEYDGGADPQRVVTGLLADGTIDSESAAWLHGWLDRLAARLPADVPKALVHGDLAPQNLLESGGRLTGVVDWGDAMWADPAIDFAKMPLTEVPAMLEGYRGGGDWEARILWHHLSWALGRLADPTPRPGQRHWTAPPASRLLGLLRFFAAGPPAPWSALS